MKPRNTHLVCSPPTAWGGLRRRYLRLAGGRPQSIGRRRPDSMSATVQPGRRRMPQRVRKSVESRPRFRPFGSLKPSGSLAALAEYNQSSARRILRKDYLAVVAGHR